MSLPIRVTEPQPYTDEMGGALADCPCVELVVRISREDAERLAAHKRDRAAAGADVLASEAREVADPVFVALVAAGYALAQP